MDPILGQADANWLEAFHAGDRSVMESCYRVHFQTVAAAVGGLLSLSDKENVIHEVFYTLLSKRSVREGFVGGSMSAWLRTVARNRAIDYLRQQRREQNLPADLVEQLAGKEAGPSEERAEARRLLGDFQRDHLPEKWRGVFEARFVRQLPQRAAAASLGISRTTLAYQEQRIRWLLRRYLLRGGEVSRYVRR